MRLLNRISQAAFLGFIALCVNISSAHAVVTCHNSNAGGTWWYAQVGNSYCLRTSGGDQYYGHLNSVVSPTLGLQISNLVLDVTNNSHGVVTLSHPTTSTLSILPGQTRTYAFPDTTTPTQWAVSGGPTYPAGDSVVFVYRDTGVGHSISRATLDLGGVVYGHPSWLVYAAASSNLVLHNHVSTSSPDGSIPAPSPFSGNIVVASSNAQPVPGLPRAGLAVLLLVLIITGSMMIRPRASA